MKSLIKSSFALIVLVCLSSCETVKPAGSLGYALDGEARGLIRASQRDYHEMAPLPQNQSPMMWSAGF